MLTGFKIVMDQDELGKRKRSSSVVECYDPKKRCHKGNIDRENLEYSDNIIILNEFINKKDLVANSKVVEVKSEKNSSCDPKKQCHEDNLDYSEDDIVEEFINKKYLSNSKVVEVKLEKNSSECRDRTPSSLKRSLEDKSISQDKLEYSEDDDELIIIGQIINTKRDLENSEEKDKVKLEKKYSNSCSGAGNSRTESSKLEKEHRNNLKNSENDEVNIVKEIVVNKEFQSRPNIEINESLYYCEDCDISTNSEKAYEDHMHGKKHRKKVQSQTPDVFGQRFHNIPIRYLSPPPEYRRYGKEVSLIQNAAETLKDPCPALNYITEIQDLKEAYYWCKLCHSLYYLHEVLSHLNDFKHKMKCLKLYDFATYRRIHSMNKREAEYRLPKILKDIIKRYGYGQINVEKKDKDSLTCNRGESNWKTDRSRWRSDDRYKDHRFERLGKHRDGSNSSANNNNNCTRRSLSYDRRLSLSYDRRRSSSYRRRRSSSYDSDHRLLLNDVSSPDPSRYDFYCQICDAHMNNNSMWESHIRGARHIKNCKKEPGELPSKLKSVIIPNARAKILYKIDELRKPVVGLEAIQEIYDADLSLYKYRCFLCGASLTSFDIIDHIFSLKHREKFLEKIEYPPFQYLKEMHMSDWNKESLINEMCEKIEAERGRGHIEVRTTDVNFKWSYNPHESRYAKY